MRRVLLLAAVATARGADGGAEVLATEHEVFHRGEFQMCEPGCRLFGSPQLKAFVAEQVDPGWYPHVTVTHAVGREPHFVVFNEAGSVLYERDVEYMSSGALQYMLTTFGFHRNDTKVEGGGDPRKAARGSLKGHARTAVATRARLRAAAAAAKAAAEAEQQAAEAAAKAAREEEARKLEENSKRSAEEALAQGKGNATVNTPLDAPASAQPKVAEVAQPQQQAPQQQAPPQQQQQQQQQPQEQAKTETPKPPAPEQPKAAPAQQQQQQVPTAAGGGNQTH